MIGKNFTSIACDVTWTAKIAAFSWKRRPACLATPPETFNCLNPTHLNPSFSELASVTVDFQRLGLANKVSSVSSSGSGV